MGRLSRGVPRGAPNRHAVCCLDAVRHVYAEKPYAYSRIRWIESLKTGHLWSAQSRKMVGVAFDVLYLVVAEILI